MMFSGDKDPTELSCAERAVAAPQTIFVNRMAANIALNYAVKLIRGESINSFGTYFSIKNNVSKPLWINKKSILEAKQKEHEFINFQETMSLLGRNSDISFSNLRYYRRSLLDYQT